MKSRVLETKLDGHHRQKALQSLIEDGRKIPEQLPAAFIRCKDKKEAAKFLLIYSSIYAKIQNTGLDAFLTLHDIQLEEISDVIDLPDFSLHRFEQTIDFDEENDFRPSEEELQAIVVKPEDKFQLGNHKLYCVDCKERLRNAEKQDDGSD